MPGISRRKFATGAIAAVTAAVALPEVFAQSAPPQQANPRARTAAASPGAEVEARVNWILAKYGARLDDAQRADIRRIIAAGQGGIEAMRAYPLTNGEAPPLPFQAVRKRRREPGEEGRKGGRANPPAPKRPKGKRNR